jgi:hypothetical protein
MTVDELRILENGDWWVLSGDTLIQLDTGTVAIVLEEAAKIADDFAVSSNEASMDFEVDAGWTCEKLAAKLRAMKPGAT